VKRTTIAAERLAKIRQVGLERARLKAEIDRLRGDLEAMPTSIALAREHGIPVNTVRQIMLGDGYGGRPMTRSVVVKDQASV
jgi:hypothetical protein